MELVLWFLVGWAVYDILFGRRKPAKVRAAPTMLGRVLRALLWSIVALALFQIIIL